MQEPANHPLTILPIIDQAPPFVIYYLSHRGRGRRLKFNDLVKESGLTRTTFARVYRKISWAGVKVSVMDAFCQACGLTPLDADRVLALLREESSAPVPFGAIDENHCRSKMLKHMERLFKKSVLAQDEQHHAR